MKQSTTTPQKSFQETKTPFHKDIEYQLFSDPQFQT